jgi:hypothetical protein
METDLAVQLENAHTAITVLIAGVLIAIGYILTQPLPAESKADFCPLHRKAVADCRNQHKLD